MVLVFPIGIPLLYYVTLLKHRHVLDPVVPSTGKRGRMREDVENTVAAIAIRKNNETLGPLVFLFESYEPQYWYWEVFVCFNRVLLTNVDVLFVNAPKLQLILILALVLVDLELTSNCAPYIDDADDVFADVAQWCTVAILLFSITLEVGGVHPESSGVGLLFILPFFAVIIAFVAYGIDYAWEDIIDTPKHVLSATSTIMEAGARVSKNTIMGKRAGVYLRRGSKDYRQTKKCPSSPVSPPRSVEAGLDPTPEDGSYFPGFSPFERNVADIVGAEIAIIEEESVQELVQAPDQKLTEETGRLDYSGFSCLDKQVSEYGLELGWDMDKNNACLDSMSR
mmetsp:Transcript_45294/g.61827  ORF Transcript_45294/g.61827 Transcript_45294/m.61827 type:complete len:338 (+) Transcript_45294:3446-4459(+)